MRDVVNILVYDLLANIDLGDPGTRAAVVATVYFGTFLTIGCVAKVTLARWMARHGEDLAEIQKQAGPRSRKVTGFLLGIWYRR